MHHAYSTHTHTHTHTCPNNAALAILHLRTVAQKQLELILRRHNLEVIYEVIQLIGVVWQMGWQLRCQELRGECAVKVSGVKG